MKLLLKISYLGGAYCGYQVQPNAVTVQQKLNEAAERLFGYPCDIVGCSRTDSGVHANEFCATVSKKGEETLQTSIPVQRIPLAFSAHLPEDICVFDALWVSEKFHARYDVSEKEYLYRIYNRSVRSPLEEGRAFHVPKRFSEEDLERMRRAAAYLVGTHDFSAYMAQGSKIVDTVRTVFHSDLERSGDLILYRVRANGFLYNMVRILAGTLLEVGEGKLAPEEIPAITASCDRRRAGSTAPAHGLYLNRVIYPESALAADWEGQR
ncbi:MAG: tRNA pseudouridine(38-40) synthase TruA [Ruminococcaceae bacterium]|nr:tRNA pseudouridine(38-40) synthase TruA [Oscillospiraceae bacterium]